MGGEGTNTTVIKLKSKKKKKPAADVALRSQAHPKLAGDSTALSKWHWTLALKARKKCKSTGTVDLSSTFSESFGGQGIGGRRAPA